MRVEDGTTDIDQSIASKYELFRLAMNERNDGEAYYSRLAKRTVSELEFDLQGALVLEVGCGQGFDGHELRLAGADVVAFDIDFALAKQSRSRGSMAVTADAFDAPFPNETFDGVYCSNTVEHVPSVPPLIDEIARVTKPGGWAWISWTNWFSPWGGHQIIPFHYLGPNLGPRVFERVVGRPTKDVPGEELFATYVGKTIEMIKDHPQLEFQDAVPRYYPSQKWITRVPGLREVLTWNCVITATKR